MLAFGFREPLLSLKQVAVVMLENLVAVSSRELSEEYCVEVCLVWMKGKVKVMGLEEGQRWKTRRSFGLEKARK